MEMPLVEQWVYQFNQNNPNGMLIVIEMEPQQRPHICFLCIFFKVITRSLFGYKHPDE